MHNFSTTPWEREVGLGHSVVNVNTNDYVNERERSIQFNDRTTSHKMHTCKEYLES